ncbi:MAG: ComEC family competence protein [Bacteroidales bacterium]|nr:ComEC family competence protein [Bacteroidales bacterium]
MLRKEIPFVRIVLPLCAGIISGVYYTPGLSIILSVAVLSLLLFVAGLTERNREESRLFGAAFFITLIMAGNTLYCFQNRKLSRLDDREKLLLCRLAAFPEEREKSIRLKMSLSGAICGDSVCPLEGSVLFYCRSGEIWESSQPGDIFLIRCRPSEIRNRGNPFEFDYRFYMVNKGVRYYAFIDNRDILLRHVPASRSFPDKALILSHRIVQTYSERGVSGERLAAVAAVTLGEKRMLGEDMKQDFIAAGVMHIMAVSGLHAVILSMLVMNILFFLRKKMNWARILISLAVLWIFSFMTGLTPSVLRATMMFTFYQAGNLLKRPVNPVNSVLASAFLLILINPGVIFDAGFLLSYSAVLFIICFYNPLSALLNPEGFIARKCWQLASVSLVAQAATVPLTIMMFNRFPLYFLFANIIIVPLSTLMLVLGCLVPLTYPLVRLSEGLAWLLDRITGLTLLITHHVADLPSASVMNIGMTTPECISLSVVLFFLLRYLLNRKTTSPLPVLAATLLYVTLNTAAKIKTRSTDELIVYNSMAGNSVGIRSGMKLSLYCSAEPVPPEVLRHCSALGLKLNMSSSGSGNVLLRAGESRILLTDRLNREIMPEASLQYIVLTGRPGPNDKTPELPGNTFLIVASTLPKGMEASLTGKMAGHIHLVSKSGAFVDRLDPVVK